MQINSLFWNWMLPPRGDLWGYDRTARNAYYSLMSSFPLLGLLFVYSWWFKSPEIEDGLCISIAVSLIYIVLLILLRNGFVVLVSHAIVLTATIAVSTYLLFNGGIRNIGLIVLPIVILYINILLGGRALLFYGTLIVALLVGIYWAEVNQLIPFYHEEPITPGVLFVVLAPLVVLAAYFYITFTHNVRSDLQVEEQSASLLETVHNLQRIRSSLEQRTAELSRKNEQLLAMQHQLAEAEKLAALSNLVAGVAHEINTPLGIGITAATTLKMLTEELQEHYVDGKIRRSYFEEFLADALTADQLLIDNLVRVDQLVQSFKQLSVDHVASERRRFQLKPFLEEIVHGLEPHFGHGQLQVEILVDENIYLDSFPGALAQVITNLLMNSVFHGYPDGRPGKIQLIAGLFRQYLRLIYVDDGVGIAKIHLDKIYEPFFTTARDRGGTGLGLHLVYNLVTHKLRGTIRHESDVNIGVVFSLELPLRIDDTKYPS